MKKWEKIEMKELEISLTKEEGTTCYCEEGDVLRHGHTNCGGHHGGHHHKPPHQGGHCPDRPQDKPNKPQCNQPACPGFGPNGPVTPELDAVPAQS